MNPCKNCLIIPTCRHKQFPILIIQCIKLHNYLYPEELADDEIKISLPNLDEIHEALKPTKWSVP